MKKFDKSRIITLIIGCIASLLLFIYILIYIQGKDTLLINRITNCQFLIYGKDIIKKDKSDNNIDVQNANGTVAPSTQKGDYRTLHIEGSQLLDANNEPVLLNGINLCGSGQIDKNFSKWYNDLSISSIQSWGMNTIRIMVDVSQYETDPSLYDKLTPYIDLFIDHNMYVIVSWMGNQDFDSHLDSAIDFFTKLGIDYKNSPYIIYEIANEPFHRTWDDISSYANLIVPCIRNLNANAIILVPTPYWLINSDTDNIETIINDPLQYNNIMYTTHMYVGTSLNSSILNQIENVIKNELPIIITEWGTTRSNGKDGFYEAYSDSFLDFINTHNISRLNFNMSDFCIYGEEIYDSSISLPNQWDSSLSDSSLSLSGYYVKHKLIGDYQSTQGCTMMNFSPDYAFWKDTTRNKITNIYFCTNSFIPKDIIQSWDMSMAPGTGNVIAYITPKDNSSEYYKLYIVAKFGNVVTPPSTDRMFENFINLETISFDNCDFSNTYYTSRLFSNCSSLKNIDLAHFNTDSLTTMNIMFNGCSSLTELNLSNCNLDKVDNLYMAFANCPNLQLLDISSITTNTIKNYERAFENTGTNSEILQIFCGSDTLKSEILKQLNVTNVEFNLD